MNVKTITIAVGLIILLVSIIITNYHNELIEYISNFKWIYIFIIVVFSVILLNNYNPKIYNYSSYLGSVSEPPPDDLEPYTK